MKKIVFLVVIAFISFNLSAQNQTKEDSRIEREILFGSITKDAFKMDVCKKWFTPEYESYKLDGDLVKQLKNQNFNNITIDIVLGSWCHDSHREVPRMIKILEKINFPFAKLEMNALDTNKTSPDYDAQANNVEYVPTIIVYKNKKEIGRIIESSKTSLENDLLIIISKN